MNSEKVKEIKKALENCQKNNCLDCPYFIDEKRCRANDLLLDTINLINELESENERLIAEKQKVLEYMKTDNYAKLKKEDMYWGYQMGIGMLEHEIDRQKDRIAELEKQNESLKGNIVYREKCEKELVNACNECNSKIEKFAERLKGKFEHCVGDIYHADTIDERIDETLKEFINNKGDDKDNE